VGAVALILEGIAYSGDREWNAIVQGEEPFPEIHRLYFRGKMMHVDGTFSELDKARKLILRDAVLEPLALLFMCIYLVLVLQRVFMYAQVNGTRQAVGLIIS